MPASSYVNRDHAGGAVDTTIGATITGSDLSITLNDATGWPTGGANGPFHVIVSYDLAGKEKIEVQSRTGTTLTIADTGKRGIDGTSALGHASGAKIRHCVTAIDIQEANDHITNPALDHHTQYLTTARHAAISHTQAMLGTDSVGSTQIQASAVGSSELASGAVTAGKIATGGISAAAQFAAGVVDSAAIAADAVGSSEISVDAVTSTELAAGAVTSSELAAGAVIAGRIAAGGVSSSAEIANGIVTLAKIASEAGTDYDPNFDLHNVTLGTGGVQWGRYFKIGRLVLVFAGFGLGTSGGNVTGEIGFELPFPPIDITPAHATIANTGFITAALASDASPSQRWSGLGLIVDGSPALARSFATAGATNIWDATAPFDWTNTDNFVGLAVYEATS